MLNWFRNLPFKYQTQTYLQIGPYFISALI